MTELRTVDAATARHLLTTMRDLHWSWTAAELPGVVETLGGTNLRSTPRAALADATWGASGREVRVTMKDGRVNRLVMRVSEQAGAGDEAPAPVHEAWTGLVTLATDLLGQPTRRGGGPNPDAQWQGDQSTIGVKNAEVAVVLTWAGNEFQDEWNSYGDAP